MFDVQINYYHKPILKNATDLYKDSKYYILHPWEKLNIKKIKEMIINISFS
jgi:hypothetical protein